MVSADPESSTIQIKTIPTARQSHVNCEGKIWGALEELYGLP